MPSARSGWLRPGSSETRSAPSLQPPALTLQASAVLGPLQLVAESLI